MKFLRDSLTKKAIFLFTILSFVLLSFGVFVFRNNINSISVILVLSTIFILLIFLLLVFLLDVVLPLNKITKQVRNLLSGKNYQRIKPSTVDEIGIFTHFFNEITQDLEKISYDVRERRRMSSELDIAAQIQKDVLPKVAPESIGLDIVAKNRSAAEVGGDSFDFLSSSDSSQIYIYIGDVTGHGVPAGLVMVMVDTLIHSMVSMGLKNSKDILVGTNTLLTPRISARLFMTLVMLRWDMQNKKMYYTGAGHEHMLIYRSKTEKVEEIKSGGIALGMIVDNSKVIKEQELNLEVGDSIVLYTDGITEAKNNIGDMYNLEGLSNSLKKHGYLPSADSIFDHLTKDFSDFVGEYVQVDDITMIVIKYTGEKISKKIQLSVHNNEDKHVSSNWNWT